jgi:hypothetical protein
MAASDSRKVSGRPREGSMRLHATFPDDPDQPIKAGLAEWAGVLIVGSIFLLMLLWGSLKALIDDILTKKTFYP